jgi:hypothetical protein
MAPTRRDVLHGSVGLMVLRTLVAPSGIVARSFTISEDAS